MISHILVAGDSNTFGSETIADYDMNNPGNIQNAYGKHLQTLLNIPNYINVSQPGISNHLIAGSLFLKLEELRMKGINTENLLVIVGLTEFERFDLAVLEEEKKSRITSTFTEMLMSLALDNSFEIPDHKEWYNRKVKGKPFMPDFLRGLMYYVLPTNGQRFNSFNVRIAIDNYLSRLKCKYLIFPSLYENFFTLYPLMCTMCNKNNNLFTYKSKMSKGQYEEYLNFARNVDYLLDKDLDFIINFKTRFSIIDDFVMHKKFAKYGVAKGGHLLTAAQYKLAEFLLSELRTRKIIEV